MASTILSDNGVSSGSAGLKTSADSTGVLALQTTTAGGTATTAITVDTSQNVGIGTTTPSTKLHVNGAITYNGAIGEGTNLNTVASTGTSVQFASGSTWTENRFYTGGSERMRIDSSGNLLVGTTSVLGSGSLLQVSGLTSAASSIIKVGTDGNGAIVFRNSANTTSGSISVNTSSTTYATSSDYRLKESITPMTGALAKVALLKPVTYKWKVDGSSGQGFIAHELQSVVPDCVTGDKDAVDEDGKPTYQAVDTSFLVATLTAAIQELKAELDELKAKVNA